MNYAVWAWMHFFKSWRTLSRVGSTCIEARGEGKPSSGKRPEIHVSWCRCVRVICAFSFRDKIYVHKKRGSTRSRWKKSSALLLYSKHESLCHIHLPWPHQFSRPPLRLFLLYNVSERRRWHNKMSSQFWYIIAPVFSFPFIHSFSRLSVRNPFVRFHFSDTPSSFVISSFNLFISCFLLYFSITFSLLLDLPRPLISFYLDDLLESVIKPKVNGKAYINTQW